MIEIMAKPVAAENLEPMETTLGTSFNSSVGINEAARLTKRSKGQISKDTTSGKLSFQLNERGNKEYQVSELARVYGLKTGTETSLEVREQPEDETTKTTVETAVELALLRQQVETLKRENSDLREDKAKLWEQTQQLTNRLLAAPAAEPSSAENTTGRKSFWQRLFGQ